MKPVLSFLRNIFAYLFALWRPSLRLDRSPERFLMPFILATLTVLAVFACLLPLKIAAGGAHEARGVEGHLVVHIAQGTIPSEEFQGQVAQLVSRLEENENIAEVAVATGPELERSMKLLFGEVNSQDQLYGGIVRLDLLERPGRDANVENLQFAVSNFDSANVDDFRTWKEASQRRTRQALVGGGLVLVLILILIGATLNLTIRLALRMHQRTLRVLHHLGATDGFGAMVFQSTTFQRALIGTVAGALTSLGLLWIVSLILAERFPGAAQVGTWQIVTLIALPLCLLIFAVFVARQTAMRFLRRTY